MRATRQPEQLQQRVCAAWARMACAFAVALFVLAPASATHAEESAATQEMLWPKTLTVVTDSVALVVGSALRAALPGWRIGVLGRPALMVNQAIPEFLKDRNVGAIVVVGLGYNSQFEKDRKNEARWIALWDHRAEHLLRSLKQRGAKKVIWLTLREPSVEVVTRKGQAQYELYAWYFPYVNERIRELAKRHPEVIIADWASVSDVPDVTTDLIHLNKAGAKLMAETIARALQAPSRSSAASTRGLVSPRL